MLASFLGAVHSVAVATQGAEASPPKSALAAYREMAASQSRNYDRMLDISPRQMVALLEVSERTGANLGQALATGEFESAHTWNDFVRPPLRGGKLGSATGVWQFQPATFHSIVRLYGTKLLAASEADASLGLQRMDLGAGPFGDAEVRSVIRETVEGSRGADDEELRLLRHNFAVLAFAKHYLSVDSGAASPEEDALYHLLGASQAKQVLALARGDAKDTLSVKPKEAEPHPPQTSQELVDELFSVTVSDASATPQIVTKVRLRPALHSPPAAGAPPPVSSARGLPADSPVVTNNPGMFYRDGKERTRPYTWAEFMTHFARRVQAKRQPTLVRAKYGVGFELNGGDSPERAFNPKKQTKTAEFHDGNGESVRVPEPLLIGPLNQGETRWYKQRLAELVSRGEDQPTDALPPKALAALHQLRILPLNIHEARTSSPKVRQALHDFRRKVGKDEPDDPAHVNLLMPAERVALEIYGQRLARYAALQAAQHSSLARARAPDLNRIQEMPAWKQRFAALHIAELQRALAAQGLLNQPRKKSVWRNKKGRKRVKYKTLPFAGKVDGNTVTAFSTFQLGNGLQKTGGVLDAVSLGMLGLAPMGPEIFLPIVGPQCAINQTTKPASMCEIPAENKRGLGSHFGPFFEDTAPSL
jgi:hypothetical protein